MRKERNYAIYSTDSSENTTDEGSEILDSDGTVPLWSNNESNDDDTTSNDNDDSTGSEVTRQSFSEREVVCLESGEASPET